MRVEDVIEHPRGETYEASILEQELKEYRHNHIQRHVLEVVGVGVLGWDR